MKSPGQWGVVLHVAWAGSGAVGKGECVREGALEVRGHSWARGRAGRGVAAVWAAVRGWWCARRVGRRAAVERGGAQKERRRACAWLRASRRYADRHEQGHGSKRHQHIAAAA